MLHVGGWYDIWLRSTTDNYMGLSKLKESPIHMLIGPWDHGGNTRHTTGDVDFGPDAAIPDFGTDFQLRWFDHFLKGQDTGVNSSMLVRLFLMGSGDGHKTPEGKLFHGGSWIDAADWPAAQRARYTLLLPSGREPPDGATHWRRSLDNLHLRSEAPRPDHRRECVR